MEVSDVPRIDQPDDWYISSAYFKQINTTVSDSNNEDVMVVGPHSQTYSVCNGESEFKRGVIKRIVTPVKPCYRDVQNTKDMIEAHECPVGEFQPILDDQYIDLDMLDDFVNYVRENVSKHFPPLDPGWNIHDGFETYIKHSRETVNQKEVIRNDFNSMMQHFDDKAFRSVNCFPKNEFYAKDFKEARCINGCDPKCKAYMAPIVHAIERIVFRNTHFIKGLDEHQKAWRILKKSRGWSRFAANDMTSFESCQHYKFQEIERIMWRHFLVNQPELLMNVLKLYDYRHCKFVKNKKLWFRVNSGRMSGDQFTSLGNGWANYWMITWALDRQGIIGDFLVEGDDCIVMTNEFFTFKDLSYLGMICKDEYSSDLNELAFVSIRQYNGQPVPDLTRLLPKFGKIKNATAVRKYHQSPEQYIKQSNDYLYTKSICYLASYPGVPILQEMCLKCMQYATEHGAKFNLKTVGDKHFQRKYNKINTQLDYARPITDGMREFVHRYFGIAPRTQIDIENEIRSQDTPCFTLDLGLAGIGTAY